MLLWLNWIDSQGFCSIFIEIGPFTHLMKLTIIPIIYSCLLNISSLALVQKMLKISLKKSLDGSEYRKGVELCS